MISLFNHKIMSCDQELRFGYCTNSFKIQMSLEISQGFVKKINVFMAYKIVVDNIITYSV